MKKMYTSLVYSLILTATLLQLNCLDDIPDEYDLKGPCVTDNFGYENTLYCRENVSYYECDSFYKGMFYSSKTCTDLDYTSQCSDTGPATLAGHYLLPETDYICNPITCLHNKDIYVDINGSRNYIPVCEPARAGWLCAASEVYTPLPDQSCLEAGFENYCHTGSIAGFYVNAYFITLSNYQNFCGP